MAEPTEVWDLIRRADEFAKYASNRDPKVARDQARATLDEAETLNEQLADEKQRAHFAQQIELRRADLDRYDAGDAP